MVVLALLILMSSGDRYAPTEVHIDTVVIDHITWKGCPFEPETVWVEAWKDGLPVDVLDVKWNPQGQTYKSPLIVTDKQGHMWKIHYREAWEMWRHWQEDGGPAAKDHRPVFILDSRR